MNENLGETEKYFDLIERVGTSGRYQWLVFCFSMLTFLYNACTLFSIPLLFYNSSFDCSNEDLTFQECEDYVCNHLSEEEIRNFPTIQEMKSIATEYGPYHCDENITLSLYRSLLGVGQFIGMIVAIMISDNISRRKAFLFCLSVSNLGMLIMFLSATMEVALVGLFTMGLSNAPLLRIIQAFVSEVTEKDLRQKFLTSMWISQSAGLIIIGIIYPAIGNWRYSILFTALLPGFFIFMAFFYFVEDTPKYLLHQSPDEAARALNRIGRMNKVPESELFEP